MGRILRIPATILIQLNLEKIASTERQPSTFQVARCEIPQRSVSENDDAKICAQKLLVGESDEKSNENCAKTTAKELA